MSVEVDVDTYNFLMTDSEILCNYIIKDEHDKMMRKARQRRYYEAHSDIIKQKSREYYAHVKLLRG